MDDEQANVNLIFTDTFNQNIHEQNGLDERAAIISEKETDKMTQEEYFVKDNQTVKPCFCKCSKNF